MSEFPFEDSFSSEASTRGVRIRVHAVYDPVRSEPANQQWFFLYTVTISNLGEHTVQLLSRHWIIEDESGQVEEVRGPGVVGEQPVLPPGGSFEYTSGCPLGTPSGTMKGSYRMVEKDGESFEAEVAPFLLSEPLPVN
ncbi:MAG: Co2+/Mg2+ efflux protein ApaG [Acidobacteriota bacterium]